VARRNRRSIPTAVVLVVVFVAVACSACSSGSGSSKRGGASPTTTANDGRTNWDRPAALRLAALAKRVSREFAGQCVDIATLPYDAYKQALTRLHLDPPLAVADCTAFGNQAEFNAFPSGRARDTWGKARTEALCAAAKAAKFQLSGLRWVVTPTDSIQVNDETTGRELARTLRAEYLTVACPGVQNVDWEPAGETRVDQLAAALRTRPNLRCDSVQWLDHDQYARNPQYRDRLPSAYARCDGPGGTIIWIAVFPPGRASADVDAFIEAEAKSLCTSDAGVVVVRGKDWAMLVTDVHVADVIAAALDGTRAAPTC
jgi:hypothetical protein